jgi:hypothetical protein
VLGGRLRAEISVTLPNAINTNTSTSTSSSSGSGSSSSDGVTWDSVVGRDEAACAQLLACLTALAFAVAENVAQLEASGAHTRLLAQGLESALAQASTKAELQERTLIAAKGALELQQSILHHCLLDARPREASEAGQLAAWVERAVPKLLGAKSAVLLVREDLLPPAPSSLSPLLPPPPATAAAAGAVAVAVAGAGAGAGAGEQSKSKGEEILAARAARGKLRAHRLLVVPSDVATGAGAGAAGAGAVTALTLEQISNIAPFLSSSSISTSTPQAGAGERVMVFPDARGEPAAALLLFFDDEHPPLDPQGQGQGQWAALGLALNLHASLGALLLSSLDSIALRAEASFVASSLHAAQSLLRDKDVLR